MYKKVLFVLMMPYVLSVGEKVNFECLSKAPLVSEKVLRESGLQPALETYEERVDLAKKFCALSHEEQSRCFERVQGNEDDFFARQVNFVRSGAFCDRQSATVFWRWNSGSIALKYDLGSGFGHIHESCTSREIAGFLSCLADELLIDDLYPERYKCVHSYKFAKKDGSVCNCEYCNNDEGALKEIGQDVESNVSWMKTLSHDHVLLVERKYYAKEMNLDLVQDELVVNGVKGWFGMVYDSNGKDEAVYDVQFMARNLFYYVVCYGIDEAFTSEEFRSALLEIFKNADKFTCRVTINLIIEFWLESVALCFNWLGNAAFDLFVNAVIFWFRLVENFGQQMCTFFVIPIALLGV